jgi:hypothetical protein
LLTGLALFVQGLLAWRAGAQVQDLPSSPVATLAAGEVRVSGTVRPAGVLLVSPLQSRDCVYYRARVREEQAVAGGEGGRTGHDLLDEARGVGFFLDDGSGRIRVLVRGARWDVPDVFRGDSSLTGEPPEGLDPNRGPATRADLPTSREAAIAALLTVRGGDDEGLLAASGLAPTPLGDVGWGRREYREARLEPGQAVTIVGTAVPYGQLDDPSEADAWQPGAALEDPEIAADVAAAQARGGLASSPEAAWGNAAIPGFGIGHPTRPPTLDAAARQLPTAPTATEQQVRMTFDIGPDDLVLAATPDGPLAILAGTPGQAVGRDRSRAWLGVAGAGLALVCAVGLAVLVSAA